MPGVCKGLTFGIVAVGDPVAGVGLIAPGAGELPGVGVMRGEAEIVGVGAITGEGETVGIDDVGILLVQADSEIVPIPINNLLKYFTIELGVKNKMRCCDRYSHIL
jgi:hypothetical protein